MTPDALRSLPPGAELDAVIAGLLGMTHWMPMSTCTAAAAWMLDAADRTGWAVSVKNDLASGYDGRKEGVLWWCWFGLKHHPWFACGRGSTFPEAVSKAFALAVLQQPKE
jgi:hypothetical protein